MIDPDKLRALDEKATPGNIEVRQHTKANADAKNKALDRVKLSNQIGPLGGFERADGELLAYLWNNRAAVLAMAEERERLLRIERAARKVAASASTLDPDLPEDANVYAPYLSELRAALGEEKA